MEGDTDMGKTTFADLAESLGNAFLKCAAELRQSADADLTIEPAVDPLAELSLGERQREMVDVLRASDENGLTTSGICQAMGGYDTANAHVALRSLQSR